MSPHPQPFTPASEAKARSHGEPAATEFVCALCGGRFTHAGLACPACPLRTGCDVVQCPHCGYQFPRGSRALDWLLGVFARRRRAG
jgi:DNA-directed RNA polymerase subunit RPC12/RpoP